MTLLLITLTLMLLIIFVFAPVSPLHKGAPLSKLIHQTLPTPSAKAQYKAMLVETANGVNSLYHVPTPDPGHFSCVCHCPSHKTSWTSTEVLINLAFICLGILLTSTIRFFLNRRTAVSGDDVAGVVADVVADAAVDMADGGLDVELAKI
jgi:hypothetical protein